MEWILLVVVGAVLAWFLLLRKKMLVDEAQGRTWLRSGAKVIDVRTPEEFAQRRLPGAVNVPLSEIKDKIGNVASSKDDVLLLHCVAGGRSGMGVRALRQLGYTRVYNLGSYNRAQRIVAAAQTLPGDSNKPAAT